MADDLPSSVCDEPIKNVRTQPQSAERPVRGTRAGDAYLDPDRPGVARVPISTTKYPGLEAIIDAADLPLVQGKRWNFSPGKPGSEMRGTVQWPDGMISMGRLILNVTDPDRLVSHANGDHLDCRRKNLLVRSRSEVAKARKPSEETVARLKPYPDPERAGVWRVPIRSHVLEMEVLIDEADLPIVEGRNWNWSPQTDGRVNGSVVLATTGKRQPLARLILGANGKNERVRFLNDDPLDCRRENLALMTLAEQIRTNRKMGSRKGRACSSKHRGVSWDRERGKWMVQIRCGRVALSVGRFDDELSAARGYDAASRVLFGGRGHLNLPEEGSTEQAKIEARNAVEEVAQQVRAARRRQRMIEGRLRSAADGANDSVEVLGDTAVISTETARMLFDATLPVWRRWERFGWLPQPKLVEGTATYRFTEIKRRLDVAGIVALPYPDPTRAGVWRVPLSGETANGREALIDADAVPLVQDKRWMYAAKDAGRGGDIRTMNPRESIVLHYVVLGRTGENDCHIGHRNDDPLDCRRENLVIRELTDTRANARKQATFCGRPCTSRFKGVCWLSRDECWLAYITKSRVQRRLGTFHDEIAAAQAYDEAAIELFGEHARPNFPDGVDRWLEQDAVKRDVEDAATRESDVAGQTQREAA